METPKWLAPLTSRSTYLSGGISMRRFIGVFALLLVALLLSTSALAQQTQDIISTAIGGGPNDISAVDADLYTPTGVAVDSAGNYYIAVYNANRVFKVSTKGILTVLAGVGVAGYGGDGVTGGAAEAFLSGPQDVAVDSSGNVYISDYNNFVIREVVAATNTIITIAGEAGQCNYNGDGAPATKFNLCHPVGLALDSTGADLYIGDGQNFRVRKLVLKSDTISTVAGTGTEGFSGDTGSALNAELNYPNGIAIDSAGDLFIGDSSNYRIREVKKSNGIINTVAGDGTQACTGDGGAATAAAMNTVINLSVNTAGTIVTYPDQSCQKVRQFTVGKNIDTVAGNGSYGFLGDGGAATSAEFESPQGIAATLKANQFLIADNNNYRVREFTVGGDINTVAGNGSNTTPTLTTKVVPSGVVFNIPFGVFEDKSKNVFVADTDNNMIRELVAKTDLVDFFAGTGTYGYSGDGGPALEAELRTPLGTAEDSNGNIYIADYNNCLVREVNAKTGDITTFAGVVVSGNPQCGFDGDGGPATSAKLGGIYSVAVDANNNVYLADRNNQVVREVSSGIINTIAGVPGVYNYGGDGGLAIDAFLRYPSGVAVDPKGNVFIADENNCRVREVTAATGIINTVAGNGGCGYTGDGPATEEELNAPQGVIVDANDNLFIGDTNNQLVRWVSAGGLMTTIAGDTGYGFNGDGEPATSAELAYPAGVSEDTVGDLLIADQNNDRIRGVSAFAALSVNPASLTFPLTAAGSTSNPEVVTLSSLGPLTISNIQISGPFSESDDCPGSLPNGTTCTIYVYFSPTGAGNSNGTITINDNGFFSAISTVSLTGVGTAITLSGVPVNFGNQLVNTASATKTITVTNTGTSAVTMGTISLNETTDFAIKSNTCPASGKTLAGGASCKIGVAFDPKTTGYKKGAVIINDSDPTSPQIAGVSGTGISNVVLSPSSVVFANEPLGVTGTATDITLINNTGNTLTLGNPALTISAGFVINKSVTTCTNSLQIAASGNCVIGVQFKPTVIGYQTGTLSVADSDPTSPQSVALSGTGISIGFTPTSVNFGTVTEGQCSSNDTVTIANSGPAAVTFTGSDIVGTNSPDFTEFNSTCPTTLAAGANCNVLVRFCPSTTKKESATYELFDNSLGSPQKLPMTGTGQAAKKATPNAVTK
jgi:trimeric autotransporter adhesin